MSGIPQSTKQWLLGTLSSYYPMALNLMTLFKNDTDKVFCSPVGLELAV